MPISSSEASLRLRIAPIDAEEDSTFIGVEEKVRGGLEVEIWLMSVDAADDDDGVVGGGNWAIVATEGKTKR